VLDEVARKFAKLPPAVKYPELVRAPSSPAACSEAVTIIESTPGQVVQSTFRMIEPWP
jgi:hypothetical protein